MARYQLTLYTNPGSTKTIVQCYEADDCALEHGPEGSSLVLFKEVSKKPKRFVTVFLTPYSRIQSVRRLDDNLTKI